MRRLSFADLGVLVLSAAVGWLTWVLIPRLMPDWPPPRGYILLFILLLILWVPPFALGLALPRLWLPIGLSFALPAFVLGVVYVLHERGNLWPIALAAVFCGAPLPALLAFAGSYCRRRRR
jgi:hypothetical protein